MSPQAHIAALLKATMGLDVASVGENALRHAVRQRSAAIGASTDAEYWAQLQSSPCELQELIEAVVVPETWFFRDAGAFAALTSVVCNEWLPQHPGRPLRVLSVPCSTGEEPCSIAMALLDAGLSPERFSIDGVDISERSIATARNGVYGRNSFRGQELDFRERHFERRENRFEVAERVRSAVRFHRGNLLSPAFFADAEPYDVVFCRNVLIYFDTPTQERVILTLERLLARDGIVFVGPAEPFLLRQKGFVSTCHAHAFAYRKVAAKPPATAMLDAPPPRHLARRGISGKPPLPARLRRRSAKAPALAAPAPSPASATDEADLEAATRLADAGKLAEAALACESHLRRRGDSAAGYYLLGLIHDAMGLERQARDCYRKTVYLEPAHLDALMHLALLAQKSGDLHEAHRLQNRTQRLQGGKAS